MLIIDITKLSQKQQSLNRVTRKPETSLYSHRRNLEIFYLRRGVVKQKRIDQTGQLISTYVLHMQSPDFHIMQLHITFQSYSGTPVRKVTTEQVNKGKQTKEMTQGEDLIQSMLSGNLTQTCFLHIYNIKYNTV